MAMFGQLFSKVASFFAGERKGANPAAGAPAGQHEDSVGHDKPMEQAEDTVRVSNEVLSQPLGDEQEHGDDEEPAANDMTKCSGEAAALKADDPPSPERLTTAPGEPEPMEGVELNEQDFPNVPTNDPATDTAHQASTATSSKEIQKKGKSLSEIEREMREIQAELDHAEQLCEAAQSGIRKRKAAQADLDMFMEHCKAMKIEESDFPLTIQGDSVEQAEQVMREGYARIARAALAEMEDRVSH